jgi:threonine/homoserine efflux transporter RhtA
MLPTRAAVIGFLALRQVPTGAELAAISDRSAGTALHCTAKA